MESTKSINTLGDIVYRNEYGYVHRDDGPAVILITDHKEWWINGKRHREDGPAVIYVNVHEEYWLYGTRYSYKEWLELIPNIISIKWREYCENN